MSTPIKILIVEDEMIIAANISLQLTTLGYDIIGIVPRAEEAITCVKHDLPDIVLMDINLKGDLDGIDTVKRIQKEHEIAVIYLTANADETNFNRAKSTHPHAFISKPFKKLDLQRAIELTVDRLQQENNDNVEISSSVAESSPFMLSDCIFVRHNDKMVKVHINDIFYIEAERNYCRIYSKGKEYLLVITLKDMDEKLPNKHFLRVHRSFIVNLSQIDEIATSHIVIAKKAIPVSKTLKEELLKRLQTI
ncbi:LytR/AlgR family response regulator transcription factor [Psychroserpens ponticola]|uniref:LytTR family transcriptional regulator DNA-binding domain-containing protein n=1 Tax=Psychroserpens ponticola TaxID=2932268 RepID=A0ABY7S158_9FLAO|nr:LytTR family transcriptional regulator DNA-binding domain-containing protein [Psychroserpens ponticola]WCO02735.1 LytTR family transcriptional regulator DNA-binding domain-containing protein [Psychroserpens ponticola]